MVNLKTITLENVDTVSSWASDPDYAEYFRRFPPFFMWGHPETVVQSMSNSWYIRVHDDIVGLITLAQFDAQNKKVELGLIIDKDKVKVNRAALYIDACKQIADTVFDYYGYEKIFAMILPKREKLASIMKTNGFRKEGTIRKSIFWQGKFHDEDYYGLTKADYYERFRK